MNLRLKVMGMSLGERWLRMLGYEDIRTGRWKDFDGADCSGANLAVGGSWGRAEARRLHSAADGFALFADAAGGFEFGDLWGGGANFAGGVAKVDGDYADLFGGGFGLF